jgi:DNA-binding GntR family transcriptional regulator
MNIPRRGAQVAEISERGLRDVLEVRRALDTFCAELACERISDEEKEALKKACKDFEDAVETKDVTVIAKADVAFHDIIVGATGNERLVALLNNLAEQMYRYRFEYIKDFSQHGKLIEEHRVLMDAILKGNIIGARDAAREHIDNQEKSILMQISIDANGQAKE